MSESSENKVIAGVGPASLLGITFIVLKLCGVIGWSWMWVLAPFWMPFIIGFCVVMIAVLAYAIFFGIGWLLVRGHLRNGSWH